MNWSNFCDFSQLFVFLFTSPGLPRTERFQRLKRESVFISVNTCTLMIYLISFFYFCLLSGCTRSERRPWTGWSSWSPGKYMYMYINADIIEYNTTVPLGCPALHLLCFSIFVEMYYDLIELKSIRSNQDKYGFSVFVLNFSIFSWF